MIRIPAKRHKYGARKTEYGGRVYASAAEALYAMELDVMQACGKIAAWIPQPVFPIVINNHKICRMILDFEVRTVAGGRYYVEVKGMETAVYKLKLKLLRAVYSDIDLRVVKA